MAIFHLRVDKISRSKGQSAVASAAYYSDERLRDNRTGRLHVMPPRAGLQHSEILLPCVAEPPETLDRQWLWNVVEARERRRDANTALLWFVALPRELTPAGHVELARAFARFLIAYFGCVIDLTVREETVGSPVAYLLGSTRRFHGGEFLSKIGLLLNGPERAALGLPKAPRADLLEIRAMWAQLVNNALAQAGSPARVDHRSLKERGFDLIPQTHLGSAASRRTGRGEDIDRKAGSIERDAHNTCQILAQPAIIRALIETSGQPLEARTVRDVIARYVDDDELRDSIYELVVSPRLGRNARQFPVFS